MQRSGNSNQTPLSVLSKLITGRTPYTPVSLYTRHAFGMVEHAIKGEENNHTFSRPFRHHYFFYGATVKWFRP